MAEGGKVLYYIGGILQKEAGADDIAGRLHNDVFGICTGRSRRETEALIETIAQKVKKYPLAFRFFLPAGVVEILPGSKEPVSGLCDKAIMAQRRIKGNYLCAYLFYQPEMGRSSTGSMNLSVIWKAALPKDSSIHGFSRSMTCGMVKSSELRLWQDGGTLASV